MAVTAYFLFANRFFIFKEGTLRKIMLDKMRYKRYNYAIVMKGEREWIFLMRLKKFGKSVI